MLKEFFATILLCVSLTSAINIQCEFYHNNWTPFGTLEQCLVQNLVSQEPDTQVSEISSTSNPLASYESFYIHVSPDCIYLPKNIGNHLPNLIVLVVARTGLKTITKNDLKPFDKLRGLYIDYSKLTSLSSDLFEYTKNLEELSLQENQIQYVEAGAFTPLTKLTSLDFKENSCINKKASTRELVLQLIEEIERKCHEFIETDTVPPTATKKYRITDVYPYVEDDSDEFLTYEDFEADHRDHADEDKEKSITGLLFALFGGLLAIVVLLFVLAKKYDFV